MNIKNIVASVSLLIAAGAAMAAPADLNFPGAAVQQKSSVSRDVVKAETLAARSAGELDFSEVNYPEQGAGKSVVSRSAVRSELLASRAAGLLDQNETNYPYNYNELVGRRGNVTAQVTGQ